MEGRKEKVIINVGNGQKAYLMSVLGKLDWRVQTVEQIGSLQRRRQISIRGGMTLTNWPEIKDQWKHLRGIPFSKFGKRSKIYALIGSVYHNLLFPMKEVREGDK